MLFVLPRLQHRLQSTCRLLSFHTLPTLNSRRTVSVQSLAAPAEEKADQVLKYWFCDDYATMKSDYIREEWRRKWFGGGGTTDETIKTMFGAEVEAMRKGELDHWCGENCWTCIAGILLADQFTRNVYRGTADMYCLDEKAMVWADHVLGLPDYPKLHPFAKMFVGLPLMHSEKLEDQEKCIALTEANLKAIGEEFGGQDVAIATGISNSLAYAVKHRDVIKQWGRFPHRNEVLGRPSTPEELCGLADGTIESF